MKVAQSWNKTLHAHAMQTLTRIGTQYPQVIKLNESGPKSECSRNLLQEFKTLLSHLPDLRTKLESAARASQSAAVGNTKSSSLNSGSAVDIKAAPTIKLKMDFSNFS